MSRIVPQGDHAFAPPEFGIDAHAVRTITIPLDSALDKKEFAIGGNVLWAVSASDGTATVDLQLNEQGNDAITVSRGFFMRGVAFSRIFVTCDAQAGKTLTLLYVVEGHNNVQIENPNVNQNEVEIVGPLSGTRVEVETRRAAVGLGVSGQVSIAANTFDGTSIPANANRRRLVVQNRAGNPATIDVYDGDSELGNDIMHRLAVGDSVEITHQGAVGLYNNDGVSAAVVYMFEEVYS